MKTPITYYGGKQTMLKHILPLIPEHDLYTESFCGGAAVFFAKDKASVEVINDLNGEVVNFYKVVVNNYNSLKERVDSTLHSRSMHQFAWYIYNNPRFFSEVDRAWALWCLSKLGFAGQLSSSFGFDKSKGTCVKKINNAKIAFNEDLKNRLETTTIECDDALKVIRRYDKETAFHFIDPPYVNSDMAHYSGMFDERCLERLLGVLVNIKGKFMLTMYPHPLVELYARTNKWNIVPVSRSISACLRGRRKQEEWMVMNY